jgi:hypothetical protein
MPTYHQNLAILDAFPELIHVDAGFPHCLIEALALGCNRHWELIMQIGPPVAAGRGVDSLNLWPTYYAAV